MKQRTYERKKEMKRQMIMNVIVTIMMLVGAYVAQTASADAREPKHGREDMKGDRQMHEMSMDDEHALWRHIMGLNLDEKQKAEIKEIKSRVMKENIRKRADLHLARIELKDLLDKETVDMKAVETKLKQIEAGKTEVRLSHIRAREEVKSLLTPEQRKKFKEMPEMGTMMRPPMTDHRHGHKPRHRSEG